MKKQNLKRIAVSFLAALTLVASSSQVVSAKETESYVTGDNNYRQPVPESYVVTNIVNNIGNFDDKKVYFKNPRDLFVDNNDLIYIVDSGNQRVVKMTSEFETLGVYYGPNGAFKNPQGIYVDDDGDMYVADTENHRIVHMDSNGNFIEEFTNPESELETGDVFNPTKLIVSSTGYIYVVRGENIMAIDGNNTFRGYYGQTNIGYNLSEVLMRMFASEEQRLFATKRLASSYVNITYDGEDIYATSLEREEGEIKKLNSVGTNIYRKYRTVGNSINNPITSFINGKLFKAVVAGQSFKFGEYFNDQGMYIEPLFADICVDKNGIVTVIEEKNGKVYQYDNAGRMLVAFGGLGEKKGTFTKPAAIDVDSKGNLYILDQINANVQVFAPTEFIQYVHDATTSYIKGDYQTSYELWRKVLATDENYSLAHVGIARSYYKQGEYKLAMEEAKVVSDRDVYTMAFDEYKYVVLRQYFLPIVLLAAAIIAAVIVLVTLFLKHAKKSYWSFLKNKEKKMGFLQGIEYSFNSLFHPVDAFEGIKWNRDRINWLTPLFIFALAYGVKMAYIYVIHFPLASIELEDVNPWFELVKLLIVPVSWIPASFMATSISGGESKIKEITFTSAVSLCPFIVINLPLMFLSNIMSKTQKGLFGVFTGLAWIGMFLILFTALKVLNNYSFGKTIGMMLVSGFLMLVLWLVILLCYVLTGRMIQFVIAIMNEFKLNFL